MAALGNVHIKVRPEVLDAKAGTVTGLIRVLETNFNTLDDIMKRTSGYWIGEAGDHHRDLYKKKTEETLSTMIKRLAEHPVDLQRMAGTYREAESANVSIAQGLPTDVIT